MVFEFKSALIYNAEVGIVVVFIIGSQPIANVRKKGESTILLAN